ncbi:MAG: fluoride exporter [Thermoleophilaceae bacterium]|nr:fluoride exporter [Thermoleophilaceae bacterium]
MTAGVWIAAGLLGGVGALARFGIDGAVASRWGGRFPLGTFVVNISGAFALGVLAGLAPSTDAMRLAGTALLGSYTTFSTWMLEAERSGEEGQSGTLAANIVGSLALGLAGAAVGRWLGEAL